MFEAVCDAVAERLRAQGAVIGGRGPAIPATGPPCNARWQSLLTECERDE